MSEQTRQVVQWAESLAPLVKETQMSELRLESGNQALRMRRSDGCEVVVTVPSEPAPATPEAAPRQVASSTGGDDFGTPVKSQYVGIFRSTHPKTGKAMISADDTAETNQVLGWVECMGIRYEVVAPRAGTVADVLVDDAEPVEFGQVLLVIQ